ncbi:MAG TPA: hypothetical protein VGX92_13865 [Pyrinomonadaceae bacterium]|jgi:hypothetical protein|nr:hypothetical protein [Pyrinomonadaceae bacterium]
MLSAAEKALQRRQNMALKSTMSTFISGHYCISLRLEHKNQWKVVMPISLNQEQIQQAVEIMRTYLAAPPTAEGCTPAEADTDLDRQRLSLIDNELKPLTSKYLSDQLTLSKFKTKIDSINKRNQLWGFKGIKGQMFFNLMLNVADDESECDQELKTAIALPTNEEIASSRIKTFASYIKRIGEQHVEAGGSKHGKPNVSSVPFFLSYFWQVQDRETWPIYYTNSVNVMNDLNLWQQTGDLAADYIAYKQINEKLAEVFTKESGKSFGLYGVEHVFWFKGSNPYGENKSTVNEAPATAIIVNERLEDKPTIIDKLQIKSRLPDSYVPPIVAISPVMARNDQSLREAAKASGTSLERAFEKSIDAAFTILGYETKLLGQGKGRVPDGLALSVDDSYAILWDAKVRSEGYSMGTDDRAIKEYIVTQSRDLKRRRGLRNIYYFIISSDFMDDYDDSIRSIKMETDVNEVCLVEADALVAMVDAKLRFPHDVSLGPDGLQRYFSVSGVLSAELIRGTLI